MHAGRTIRAIGMAGLAAVSALTLTTGCGRDEKPAEKPASVDPATDRQSSPPGESAAEPPASETAPPQPGEPATPAAQAGSPRPQGPGTKALLPAPVQMFVPLADAVVGEWALCTALDGSTLRYEVIEADSTSVTTRVTVIEQGKPMGMPAERTDDRDQDLLAAEAERVGAARKVTYTTVEVAGRQWTAMLYEDRWTDEEIAYVRRTWVSSLAPVFGTLRMELEGAGQIEARLELTEFSTAPQQTAR